MLDDIAILICWQLFSCTLILGAYHIGSRFQYLQARHSYQERGCRDQKSQTSIHSRPRYINCGRDTGLSLHTSLPKIDHIGGRCPYFRHTTVVRSDPVSFQHQKTVHSNPSPAGRRKSVDNRSGKAETCKRRRSHRSSDITDAFNRGADWVVQHPECVSR